jgi:dienelactone hydrolase
MNMTLSLICTLLFAFFATTAQAQQQVADFAAGPPNGTYAFASSNPKTLADLLKDKSLSEPATAWGHLFLPPGSGKVPAIVLLHGSGGISSSTLEFWPQQFNKAGYAVMAMDIFGPRGVQSTADDQSQVPFGADVSDAFAALQLLATHPRIDAKQIAVMGFSRGGIATWRTGVERIVAAQKLPGGLRFAAHVPVYSGGCVGPFRLIVKPGVFDSTPMLWIHGTADDYTPIGPCQDYAERIGKAGTPVEFVAIDGARHKFDADNGQRINVRGAQRTKDACPVEVDIDTLYAYNRFTNQRLQGPAYAEALKTECSAIGATVEGDRAARDKAAQAALGFFGKVFVK